VFWLFCGCGIFVLVIFIIFFEHFCDLFDEAEFDALYGCYFWNLLFQLYLSIEYFSELTF
jgi:hypothetical protein